MENKRFHEIARLLSIVLLFFAVIGIYFFSLVDLQIAGQDYYTMASAISYRTRTETIKAQRGEIFDRNGIPLVTNSYVYNIQLDGGTFPSGNENKNELLLSLTEKGAAYYSLPTSPFFVVMEGEDIVCTYNEDYLKTVYGTRFKRILKEATTSTKYPNGRTVDDLTATNTCFVFLYRYGLCQSDYETMNYPTDVALALLSLRLDMETHNFSANEPYTLLKDVPVSFLTGLLETTPRGIMVSTQASRVYNQPGVASHILGRVGKIQSANADYYTEKGYPLDAIVGLSGVEYSFEEYLRGTDGTLTIVEDAYGNVITQQITKEPVAGNDVYLSIDLNYQKAAEQALKDNIDFIVQNALENGEKYTGEDADAGALTMIDIETGEILAIASYPSYDLVTFSQDYESLVSNKSLPLLNRALYGQYPPGSTFKVSIAATALMENILTPTTELRCEGTYSYYEDSGFTPHCWIYTPEYHFHTHGSLNISKAIQESCNCFFFETGRLCGITTMNKYCKAFGIGQHTGIELGESVGVLAGPDYREAIDGEAWSPGDTCQAAIGQSDNLVTPLQLSVYIATIINSGYRVKSTILKEVRSFSGDLVFESQPVYLDHIYISPSVRSLLLNAMKDVTDYGSAASIFRKYPITVGGKTGTAQRLDNESAYATFTAFAPFENPEIVVSCIIERGAAGTYAGRSVRDMFNFYFNLDVK